MFKKIILASLLVVFPVKVHGETSGLDLTLKSEEYATTSIIRTYETKDGELFTYSIPIPSTFFDKIQASDDPLLEAKKQLTAAYLSLDLQDRLGEINNHDLYLVQNETLSVDYSYKETFESQQRTSYEFAKQEEVRYSQLSKSAKKSLYDTTLPELQTYDATYGKIPEDTNFSKESNQADAKKSDKKAANEDKSSTSEEDSSIFERHTWVFVTLLIAALISVSFYVFKRR